MAVENIIFRITTEVSDKDAPVVLAASIEKVDKEYAEAQKQVNAFNDSVRKGTAGAQGAAQANNQAAISASTLGKTFQTAANGMRFFIDAQGRARKESGQLVTAAEAAAAGIDRQGRAAQQAAQSVGGLGRVFSESAKQFAQFFAVDALVRGVFNTFRGGVDAIVEFDDTLAELSSITGATGDDLDFLREKSIEFSQSSTVGAADVAKAFTAIGSARPDLLKNGEALSAVTKEAITLSEAAKIDLGTAGAAVAGAMNQFNLPAAEASRIINVLAAGSLEGAANISDVGETIDKVGTVLAANNITIEQGVALTETLAEKNLKGAEAGTQLRNIILRLVQSGKGFVDGQFNINAALEQTKKEFDAIQDPVKRAEAQIKLFGVESVTAGNILTGNIDTFERLTTAVTGTTVGYDQAKTNNATLSASFARLSNAVENVFLRLTTSASTLGRVVNFVAENLGAIIKTTLLVIQAFVTYRTVVTILNNRLAIYEAITKTVTVAKRLFAIATTNSAGAMRAFNLAVGANPLGLLVTAVTSAISYFVLFSDSVEDATKKDKAFADQIDETAKALERRNSRIAALSVSPDDVSTADIRAEIQSLQEELDNFDPSLVEQAFEDVGVFESGAQSANPLARRIARLYDGFKDEVVLTKDMTSKDIDALLGSVSQKVNDAAKKEIAGEIEGLNKLLEERDKKLKPPPTDDGKGAPALAGTIKALQDEQKKLGALLTDKLVIGSERFNEVRDKYLAVTKALKEAQDQLQARDIFPPGSLNALNQELQTLKNALGNLPADAEGFDDAAAKIRQLEAEIKRLQERIAGGGEDGSKVLLARLDEEQRVTLAFADLDLKARTTAAENRQASEEELEAIEREGNQERLRLLLFFAKRRLEILEASGTADADELQKQKNDIALLEGELGLPASQPKSDEQKRREYVAKVAEDAQKIAQLGIDAWKAWSDAQQKSLDLQIQAQEGRVQEARELADKGNARILEEEKNRLQALNDERKRAARQSLAISQLEAAAAGAVAIARAAAEPGGLLTAFTIASTIIALTAGLAQARALTTSSIPAFRKGGSADWSRLGGYTGSGNPENISTVLGGKPYIYHADEYIMPHEVVSLGDNKRWLEQIHRGRIDIGKMMSGKKTLQVGIEGDRGTDRIVKAIESQPRTSVYMDGDGISMLVQGRIRKANMLNTRR